MNQHIHRVFDPDLLTSCFPPADNQGAFLKFKHAQQTFELLSVETLVLDGVVFQRLGPEWAGGARIH